MDNNESGMGVGRCTVDLVQRTGRRIADNSGSGVRELTVHCKSGLRGSVVYCGR